MDRRVTIERSKSRSGKERPPRGAIRWCAAAVLGTLLAACGGGPTHPPPPPTDTAHLSIGAGEESGASFTEIADGQDLELVPGAQGGFHIFLNVRIDASKMRPGVDTVVLDRQARRKATGELVSTAKRRAPLILSSDGGFVQGDRAFTMFLCPTPIGVPIRDQLLILWVRALADEADDRPLAEGTLQLRPRCPAGAQAEFCARICSG